MKYKRTPRRLFTVFSFGGETKLGVDRSFHISVDSSDFGTTLSFRSDSEYFFRPTRFSSEGG